MPASTENDAMISEANGAEEEEYNWMELQGNVYSAGIASVIMQIDAKNKGGGDDKVKGAVRITIAAAVVVLAIGLQVFLVIKVKALVCAKSVHAIREIYSEYEDHMYSQTYLTVNGKHRGKAPEFFLPDNFDSLDDEIKENVCQFPLTQPDFLFSILFMWTVTIFYEVRKCFNWARRFIMITETDYSAAHVQVTHDSEKYGLDEGTTGLTGLSKLMKTIIGLLFFRPGHHRALPALGRMQVAHGHPLLLRPHSERACPHFHRRDQGHAVRAPAAQTLPRGDGGHPREEGVSLNALGHSPGPGIVDSGQCPLGVSLHGLSPAGAPELQVGRQGALLQFPHGDDPCLRSARASNF